jgi:hypothetical protein
VPAPSRWRSARATSWPSGRPAHYHYRESEVRDILSIIDASIVGLKGEPAARFDLALVVHRADVRRKRSACRIARTQIAQLVHVADLTSRATDRVGLLQAALALVEESASILTNCGRLVVARHHYRSRPARERDSTLATRGSLNN